MMMIIYILLLAFYYLSIQAGNSNDGRKKFIPISLFVLLVFSLYSVAYLEESLWGLFIVLTLSLDAARSNVRPVVLARKFIAQLFVVLFIILGVKNKELILLLPFSLILLNPLYEKRISQTQIFLLAMGFIGLFIHSLISFEIFSVLNPSFILPETDIPSVYFYNDFRSILLSVSFFILGFSTLSKGEECTRLSPVLFIYLGMLYSLVQGLNLELVPIEESYLIQSLIVFGLVVNLNYQKLKFCGWINQKVIILCLSLVFLGSQFEELKHLALISGLVYVSTGHLSRFFGRENLTLILGHVGQIILILLCFYITFYSKAYLVAYSLLIIIFTHYLIFCYQNHTAKDLT